MDAIAIAHIFVTVILITAVLVPDRFIKRRVANIMFLSVALMIMTAMGWQKSQLLSVEVICAIVGIGCFFVALWKIKDDQ